MQSVQSSIAPGAIIPLEPNNVDESQRPQFFGLKHDPPRHLWGRRPSVVKVRKLDGEYGGLGLVEHCVLEPTRARLLAQLERASVKANNVTNKDPAVLGMPIDGQKAETNFLERKYWDGPVIHVEKRLPVYGRLIRRTSNGYTVSVAGIPAHLPLYDIPKHCHFTMEDIVRKRVFKLFIKEYYYEGKGDAPKLILSFHEA